MYKKIIIIPVLLALLVGVAQADTIITRGKTISGVKIQSETYKEVVYTLKGKKETIAAGEVLAVLYDRPPVNYRIGVERYSLGDYVNSAARLEFAADEGGSDQPWVKEYSLYYLGKAQLGAGKYAEAAKALEQMLKMKADSRLYPEATIALARAKSLGGDHGAADDLLRKLSGVLDQNKVGGAWVERVKLARAEAQIVGKRYDPAAELCKEVFAKLQASDTPFEYELAMHAKSVQLQAHLLNGDKPKANFVIDDLRKAQQSGKSAAQAAYRNAKCGHGSGRGRALRRGSAGCRGEPGSGPCRKFHGRFRVAANLLSSGPHPPEARRQARQGKGSRQGLSGRSASQALPRVARSASGERDAQVHVRTDDSRRPIREQRRGGKRGRSLTWSSSANKGARGKCPARDQLSDGRLIGIMRNKTSILMTAFALFVMASPALANSAKKLLTGGGMIGYLLWFLSIVGIALIIEHVINVRREKLAAPELIDELEALLNDGQYQEALELCEQEPNFLTNVMAAALPKMEHGYDSMEQAAHDIAEEEAIKLHSKVSWLSLLSAISPMLGLLGTVWGMIGAFDVIAEFVRSRAFRLRRHHFARAHHDRSRSDRRHPDDDRLLLLP